MKLVVVKELIETASSSIILLVFFLHDSDVVDEFRQKRLHTLAR